MTSKIISSTLMVTAVFATAACAGSTTLEDELNDVTGQEQEEVSVVVEEEPVVVKEPKWDCPDCNENERFVLSKLQDITKIKDRNALATIMGNIKSESNFHANICEGGARVPYNQCHRGGFGLIQWTTVGRYNGLGSFCRKYDCDPNTLEGQVRYMVNERQFQDVLPEFEGGGQTVRQLMRPSYYWLGWGIKGYREQYAYDYSKRLVLV